MNISRASNLLDPGESAIVLFTKRPASLSPNSEFVIKPDGSGWSGDWVIDGKRPADKVIIYYRLAGRGSHYGEILVANYDASMATSHPRRFRITFHGVKPVGTTNQTWPDFAGKGQSPAGHISK
jgi:hypothetical protein